MIRPASQRRGMALLATAPMLAACRSDDPISPSNAQTIAQLTSETAQLSTLNSALTTADLAAALLP
jgi:hypothetical protein